MLENLRGYEIVLASQSPRRRRLMEGLGVEFKVVASHADEHVGKNVSPEDAVKTISQRKAHAVTGMFGDNALIIAADTIVYIDRTKIGKPASEEEACEMLEHLSGRWHDVMTGVTLAGKWGEKCFSAKSSVCFAPLTKEEIAYYVRKAKPLDKAGAYGIQEWIGIVGIREIRGSFYNVMGLPTSRLYSELKKIPEYVD